MAKIQGKVNRTSYLLILLLLILTSIFSYAVITKTDPLPTKEILILKINGQIDGTLVSEFRGALKGSYPDYLIIQMNSSGGYYDDVLVLGREINTLRLLGRQVYFIAGGFNGTNQMCLSGCYILSTFAYQVLLESDTRYGFNHSFREVGQVFAGLEAIIYLNQGTTGRDFLDTMNQTRSHHIDNESSVLDSLLAVIQQKNPENRFIVKTVELKANQELGIP